VQAQAEQQHADRYVPPPPTRKTWLPWWLWYLLVGLAGLALGFSVGRAEATSLQERLFTMEERALEAEDGLREYQTRIRLLETQATGLRDLRDWFVEANETIQARDDRTADLQEQIDKLRKTAPGVGRTIDDGTRPWTQGDSNP
jgi:hypothetical protein